jgi:predicted HD superfamily hydrolase involved in NAD metabolism
MISSGEARELAVQFLAKVPKRLSHTESVATLAKKLAIHYHEDSEKALVASYLHDITKYYSKERALFLLSKYYSKAEIKMWPIQTWHGLTAEIYAKEHLLVDDFDTLNAIKYHTVGRPKMSLLEKIIYVSDYAEELRTFETKDIRELAFHNLDLAVYKVLVSVKNHLDLTNEKVVGLSIDAIKYYQNRFNGGI